jgi:hypothetical protein
MKRRAILEAVCRIRKQRDFWRNKVQIGEKEYRNAEECAKPFAYCAGMRMVMQEWEGSAYAFHKSAHICWQILKTA